jgi:hypothetical protein
MNESGSECVNKNEKQGIAYFRGEQRRISVFTGPIRFTYYLTMIF